MTLLTPEDELLLAVDLDLGPGLVVGCPVAGRHWIMPDWFAAVRRACAYAAVDPFYVFVVPSEDQPTLSVIENETDPEGVIVVLTDERVDDAKRDWFSDSRMHHMVKIRNQLLAVVRDVNPLFFWSLDSDMLAKEDSLDAALGVLAIEGWDAVGMRAFMTVTGLDYTSRAQLVNNRLRARGDTPGTFETDVIMAAVVMTPAAYEVPYTYHVHGEDVGWSIAAKAQGLRLGWTSRASAKHVMGAAFMDWVDPRLGW